MWIIIFAGVDESEDRYIGPFSSRRDAEVWAKKVQEPGPDGEFVDPDLAARITDGEVCYVGPPFKL